MSGSRRTSPPIPMVTSGSSIRHTGGAGQCTSNHSMQRGIARTDGWCSMLRPDKARPEALMAPGFVLHTGHPDYPETSRGRWLDNLFNHLRIDEWEQTNISAHTYGDVGVVTSAYRWSGSMYEQPFDAKGHCTDVWQLRDQQWQVVSRSCMEY